MKSQLRSFILLILLIGGGRASALDRFGCLRDIMPITEDTPLQPLRHGVEKPFTLNDGKWIIFPEVVKSSVRGFFVYSADGAAHYDSVDKDGRVAEIAALEIDGVLLDLYAQPFDLRTVHIPYMAGLTGFKKAYRDPNELGDHDLAKWGREHALQPVPEGTEFFLRKRILRLHSQTQLDEEALWTPLEHELNLRRQWIQEHNLAQDDFKVFSRALRHSCHK